MVAWHVQALENASDRDQFQVMLPQLLQLIGKALMSGNTVAGQVGVRRIQLSLAPHCASRTHDAKLWMHRRAGQHRRQHCHTSEP